MPFLIQRCALTLVYQLKADVWTTIFGMEERSGSSAILITSYWEIRQLNVLVECGVESHLNAKVGINVRHTLDFRRTSLFESKFL